MTKIIITQLLIVLGCYIIDIIAIILDLKAGIKKAKQRGEFRSSYGYRKTIEKSVKYFNFLMFALLIDAIQITACYLIKMQLGFKTPAIPVLTILFSLGVVFIEFKSFREKADDKTKKDINYALSTAKQVVKIIKDEGLLDNISSKINENDIIDSVINESNK